MTFLVGLLAVAVEAQNAGRDPIRMQIAVTNPSKTKIQYAPLREAVPAGNLRKEDIEVPSGLEVEFDSKTSLFYIVAEKVGKEVDEEPVMNDDGTPVMVRRIKLAPSQTIRFEVRIKDVWHIPDEETTGIQNQSQLAMSILEGSKHEEDAQRLVDEIERLLTEVRDFQDNDSLEKKEYIAGYWNNTEKVKRAKEALEELERYVKLATAKPDVLETEDAIDAPSRYATWLVIFIILVFMGILTGAFYFVWQRRAHLFEEPLSDAQQSAFPESGGGPEDEEA
jgi:hypothetical protein